MSNTPLRIFIGYDHRQPISYNVLQHSIIARASRPVSITPLKIDTLPIERMGLTPFTFSRFLVPWLTDYKGWALFLDSDILVLGDVVELMDTADDKYAVMMTPHQGKLRFERPSVMLWNCGHEANKILTPEYVGDNSNNLFKFPWLQALKPEDRDTDSWLIDDVHVEWNHLAGYYDKPAETPKLVHYTMGIPMYEETASSPYRDEWIEAHQQMNGSVPWVQLMGISKHAARLSDGRVLPHYHPDVVAALKQPAAE